MGHTRLGVLPKTRRWKEVIGMLDTGADLQDIALASFCAAHSGLEQVPGDPGFAIVLTTVFKFIQAAQSSNARAALADAGFGIPHAAGALDYVGALRAKIDSALESGQIKSDTAEIAQNSFSSALLTAISSDLPSLFAASPDESAKAVSQSIKGQALKALMHEFYSDFTKRYLTYHLSRELPSHVGVEQYFTNLDSHAAFNSALDLYLRQTVRISDEFTPGWLGKTMYQGALDESSVQRYAHAAFKKIASEFARGSGNGHG